MRRLFLASTFQLFFLLVELVLLCYEMGNFSLSPWVRPLPSPPVSQYPSSVKMNNIVRMKYHLGL